MPDPTGYKLKGNQLGYPIGDQSHEFDTTRTPGCRGRRGFTDSVTPNHASGRGSRPAGRQRSRRQGLRRDLAELGASPGTHAAADNPVHGLAAHPVRPSQVAGARRRPLDLYPHARPRRIEHGVRLEAQPAQKSEPVSGIGGGHLQIIHEDGVYRLWRWGDGFKGNLYYSESTDGFHWKTPRKVFSFSQMSGINSVNNLTVFKDPKGPPDERYKAMWCSTLGANEQALLRNEFNRAHPRYRNNVVAGPDMGIIGMYAAVSPDGIDWKFIPRHVLVHYNEGGTTAYYDPWLDKYVVYARVYLDDRRVVARGETSDFFRWPLRMEPVLWPDLEDSFAVDIYNNARSEVPGMPHYHLMFPYFYERDTERSSVRLFVSRDGILWDRVPGEPVIAPGPAGSPDASFIGSMGQLVPFGTDRVGILWGGTPYPHKYPRWPEILGAWQVAWATWPAGRHRRRRGRRVLHVPATSHRFQADTQRTHADRRRDPRRRHRPR